MTEFRIKAEAAVAFDVEAAFEWYEAEKSNLGFEFLEQLRRSYLRVFENPLAYQELRHGIRRALTRQFPYAIYFSIEGETILILAVLHTARDPAEWQKRV